eukprot:gb/GECG01011150.1/.p1 GENE.gb/GECG01011150.1/~~gb/GECG01011150.1/.p1  ORF type:complete len:434 (+),score=27.22 gb/GECG01011150.1/:1-1302(+)
MGKKNTATGSGAELHYEFGGPLGASINLVFLPIFVWLSAYTCPDVVGSSWPSWDRLQQLTDTDGVLRALRQSFSLEALLVITGWFAFQVLLYYIIQGYYVEGVELPNGEKLSYKINAFRCFMVSLLGLGYMHSYTAYKLTWIYDNFIQLTTATILFSMALSVFVYLNSFQEGEVLAEGGQSGNFFYDFFIGRPLNPRIADFDIKYFCELRPGLIGWIVIVIGMMAKQYEQFGTISNSMYLVFVFQMFYVLDALWYEPCIVTSMDITTDGFGVMLAFGDLSWVPVLYSLQARYLASHPVHLSLAAVAGICLLKIIGLVLFRGANLQKDRFKRDPDHPSVRNLAYIKTERGSRLLVDGYWGMARHINYLGDWLMAVAWCFPTGFQTPVTYFYAAYFALLLIHREMRDEEKCARKYGADWEKYKKKVPYRIVPHVY